MRFRIHPHIGYTDCMSVLQETNPTRDWWQDWFNEIYLDVYAHRDDTSATSEVAAVIDALSLCPGMRILDLCCGSGRHCRALHEAALGPITGVDYSMPLLRQAHTLSRDPNYVRGDMRTIPLRSNSIDAVLSFFTSFGYFPGTEQNSRVLVEMNRVLKPGGRFMLDYLNPDRVRQSLQPYSERKVGDYCIQETRALSADGNRVEKEIVIECSQGTARRFHESVRLYSLDEMRTLLGDAGLQIEHVWGGFTAAPFDPAAPRMILAGSSI